MLMKDKTKSILAALRCWLSRLVSVQVFNNYYWDILPTLSTGIEPKSWRSSANTKWVQIGWIRWSVQLSTPNVKNNRSK